MTDNSKTPKKGFSAPILKNAVDINKADEKSKLSSEKPKKKIVKTVSEPTTAEINENTNLEKPKKQKTKKKTESCPITTVSESKVQKKSKKPECSLSNSQYEDIFNAVLSNHKSNPNSQHNTPIEDIIQTVEKLRENTPKTPIRFDEGNSKKRTASSENRPRYETPAKHAKLEDTKTPPSTLSQKALSELSPWGSHFGKYPSQASSILKKLQESQNLVLEDMLSDTTSNSDNDSSNNKENSKEEDIEEFSQKSVRQSSQISRYSEQGHQNQKAASEISIDQRKRLENLQRLRNVGVWVYCCRPSCQKQRYLANVTDPQDVPDIWYCHMNPDPKYNNCLYDEQPLSAEDEADMIYNQFTAGSLVWAKVAGYPWWPAMVDDDPDLEQFYWLEEDWVTVNFYHVVFFDEGAVTRAWVSLKNIAPYLKSEKKFRNRTARGIDFSRSIAIAKEQADDAVNLSTAQRLKIYSFLARYKGPLSTSASKAKQTMNKYKLKESLKVNNKPVKKSSSKGEKKSKTKEKESKRKKNKIFMASDAEETGKEISKKVKKMYKFTAQYDSGDIKKKTKKPKNNILDIENKIDLKCEGSNNNDITKKKQKNTSKKTAKEFEEKKQKKFKTESISNPKSKTLKTEITKQETSVNQNKSKKLVSLENITEPVEKLEKENVSESENIVVEENKMLDRSKKDTNKDAYQSKQNEENTNNSLSQNFEEKFISQEIYKDTIEKSHNSQGEEDEETVQKMKDADKKAERESELSQKLLETSGKDDNSNTSVVLGGQFKENGLPVGKQSETETPSGLEMNLSQRSRSSGRVGRCRPGPSFQNTDETLGSLILGSQESKHSQSTIAEFFAQESEDAVVPEAILSQLSQPFEE